jgi:hypothetical protein
MARGEKACWRRAGNSFLSVAMTLFLIYLTLLFSCQQGREDSGQQKSEKKSEYQEYMVDSLEVTDRFIVSAGKVVKLLGDPRGEGLLSEYDENIVKHYRWEIDRLMPEIKENLAVAKRFYDKYRNRPENKFCSHWTIHTTILSLEDIDKYDFYDNPNDPSNERKWWRIGTKLATFVYRVRQLIDVQDNNTWLSTREDLQKMKNELQKEAARLKEERARLLEEKFKKK